MHKIERLSKARHRDGFDCGSEPLNLFLNQFGFVALPSNELELFLPVKTIQTALSATGAPVAPH